VATKPDADKAEASDVEIKPKKSKKKLLIVLIVVLLLVLAGGAGAWVYISKKNAAEAETEPEAVAHEVKKSPPVFLALDNMVVNLADVGGEKVAQVGITLELIDTKGSDKVKVYLPSIRSRILLLISQRDSVELLSLAGKEKLAADLLVEAVRPFLQEPDAKHAASEPTKEAKVKKKPADKAHADDVPVTGVHFYSFIIQ
jgi:flagellar FliL protein